MNICHHDDIHETGGIFLRRKDQMTYVLSIQSMMRMGA